MDKKLHPTQKKLLSLLAENIDDPLTYREMQSRLDISSTSVVSHHLDQLEKKGYLKRNPANPRDYYVMTDGPDKKIAHLNLYGLAQCGTSGNILDENPIERIPIPTKLLSYPSFDAFLVKAKGDSMAPTINEGDIVMAKKTDDIQSGKVAVCVNEEEALIKRIQKSDQKIILVSENPDFPPLLAADDFRVVGEVSGVISHSLDS